MGSLNAGLMSVANQPCSQTQSFYSHALNRMVLPTNILVGPLYVSWKCYSYEIIDFILSASNRGALEADQPEQAP